jgi:hypothetical protein
MCRRLTYLISVFMLSFAYASYTSAAIIYVDATEGEAGNTKLATGAVFTSTADGSGSDNLWRGRAFGNSATIFEAGGQYGSSNTEDCLRLVTSVSVPENCYKVYAYFWSDTSSWRIRASLMDSEGELPLFIANDPNGEATVANTDDFEEPVPMLSEDNRTLWQVYLGTTGPTTTIAVYIDDEAGHLTHNARTWYDGIGYEVAECVESNPIKGATCVDPNVIPCWTPGDTAALHKISP